MVLFNFPVKLKSFVNESLFNSSSYKNYLEPMLEVWMPEKSLITSKAKVEKISLEREDVLSIVLSPDKKWKGFIPGQFIQVEIEINGVMFKRIFSISSGIQEFRQKGQIRLSIQRQAFGKVTSYLFENLKAGAYINISEAMGSFTLEDKTENLILMIAGGVGITPILSMLKSFENENLSIVLLYYSTTERPHLFKEELLDVVFNNENISVININSDSKGFFSTEHLVEICPDYKNRLIYLCGPEAMDKHVRKVLAENNYDTSKIFSEAFTAQKPFNPEKKEVKQVAIDLEKSKKSLIVSNDKTILELLENNGQQPTYGCRMGICNQCSCKKVSGVVFNHHDNNISGTGEEYIKICSTIPMGDIKIEL